MEKENYIFFVHRRVRGTMKEPKTGGKSRAPLGFLGLLVSVFTVSVFVFF